MNKKIKLALMSLVLIPCLLLLSACSTSSLKYADKLATASKNYFFNHGENNWKDVSFTTTTESETTYYQSVEYAEGHSINKEFSIESESTEKIELDAFADVDNTLTAVRVSNISKETLEGYKPNEEQTGVVEYTQVTEKTSTSTLVKDGENFKYFYEIQVKVDGKVDDELSEKSVYTFEDLGLFQQIVKALRTELNTSLVIPTFFESFRSQMALGDGGYYSSFGAFGAEFEMTDMDFDTSQNPITLLQEYSFNHSSGKFKNTLKKSGPVKAELEVTSYSYGDSQTKTEIRTELDKELNVSYDEISISVPTGFTEEHKTLVPPTPDKITFSTFLGL